MAGKLQASTCSPNVALHDVQPPPPLQSSTDQLEDVKVEIEPSSCKRYEPTFELWLPNIVKAKREASRQDRDARTQWQAQAMHEAIAMVDVATDLQGQHDQQREVLAGLSLQLHKVFHSMFEDMRSDVGSSSASGGKELDKLASDGISK